MHTPVIKIKCLRCLILVAWIIVFFTAVLPSLVFSMDKKTYDALMIFSSVLEEIKLNYVDETDPHILVRNAIQGMMAGLDPHSAFLTPDILNALNADTSEGFSGIGLGMDKTDGELRVIASIKRSPAHRAGIKPGDLILRIDNEPTLGMTLWESAAKLKGPQGSVVLLTCVRPGVTTPFELKLSRDLVPLQSVRGVMLDQDGHGLISVTRFRSNTVADMVDVLEELESSETGLKGLILDLRNNPGGYLDQAVEMVNLFLDNGVIVSVKGRQNKTKEQFEADPGVVKREYPLIVLINQGSASASEIVAAALKDHKRAVIIGGTSFGKGSVQTIRMFSDGYGIKYTIARYYTPNNQSIQGRGVVPDIDISMVKWPDDPMLPAMTGHEKDRKMMAARVSRDSLISYSLGLLADMETKSKL